MTSMTRLHHGLCSLHSRLTAALCILSAVILTPAVPARAGALGCVIHLTSSLLGACHVTQDGEEITSDLEIECLTVPSNTIVYVSNDLIFTHSSKSTINGEVRLLTGSDITLEDNHCLDGTGRIWSVGAGVEIFIPSGKTLSSGIEITGALLITGPGTFHNDGLLIARDGAIELSFQTILTDSSRSLWGTSPLSSGALTFNRSHTGSNRLKGEFSLRGCGTFHFPVSIETSGNLTIGGSHDGGTVNVFPGTSFCYDCPSSCTCITSDVTTNCP